MTNNDRSAWLRMRNIVTGFIFAAICVQPVLIAQAKKPEAMIQKRLAKVPFIGCKSDGQVGPLEAPAGKDRLIAVTDEQARQLAYYKAEIGMGVLAPRGWNCFGTYGSNGSNLYVAPEPLNADIVFSDSWSGFTGPAIQLSGEDGGTSGRFGVAEVIARVFPAYRAFVRKVIKEEIEPASSFPYGPYPRDILHYKNRETVEYQTPANVDGLGTRSRLKKNDKPIEGVAVLEGLQSELSLSILFARLPSDLAVFNSAIIQQVEKDAQ